MNMRNIVLCILYLFLVPMGGFAQSEVVVLYPDTENKDLDEAVYQKIFLAGTIDMGKSVDWQKATCDWFRALPEGRYLLFNPRRDKGLSGEMSDFEHQVNWELEHLEKADLIIMNILAMEDELNNPTEEEIKAYLSGNLCRCSGYESQLRAIKNYLNRNRDKE